MAVGGRDVQLVLIDADALDPRGAAVGEFVRQGAHVLPQEIAVGGVERLHGVSAGEKQHAVMDEGGDLVLADRQRPGPGLAQAPDVGLADLLEPAVAEGLVGPPPHQPVAVRGRAQHGVGDRAQARERRLAPGGRRRESGVMVVRGGLHHRLFRGDRRRPARFGRRARGGWGVGGAGVDGQDVGLQVGVGLGAQAARSGRRHAGRDVVEQRLRRLRSPMALEGRPLQRRAELGAAQVRPVARGAVPREG